MDKAQTAGHFLNRVRELLGFAVGSAFGLAIDLAGFQILILSGLAPLASNAISSTLSISVVYFFVTRFAFKAERRVASYLIFFGWYGLSILVFSMLIDFVATESGWIPFVVKLLAVPVSFGLNYLFSRFLLGGTGPNVQSPEAAAEADRVT